MKKLAALYYLFYILSGGFRHFSYEFLFFEEQPITKEIWEFNLLHFAEYILLILASILFITSLNKVLTGLFFGLLLILDFYFQNWIRFESSFILMHFIPLFFLVFSFYKTGKQRNFVREAITLFVAVGYVSSFFAKAFSGWLSLENLVIKSYFLDFYNSFNIPILLGETLMKIENYAFWKSLDYTVLLFELSFLALFFSRSIRLKKILFILAVLFHILVYFFFGIGQFFLYPLVYLMCLPLSKFTLSDKAYTYFKCIVLIALFGLFLYNGFMVRFFQNSLSYFQYLYFEFSLLITTVGIFIFNILKGFKIENHE